MKLDEVPFVGFFLFFAWLGLFQKRWPYDWF